MFLLNGLYKYFAMNTSFRVSLLYLLLIIPQHGNSPLPVMESWLQKDQDDGFVQRDMTSSLTGGDESFGSAHQTYQNSLIRKKKADTGGSLLPSVGYRKFTSKHDRNQLYEQPNPFFDGRYVNQDFSPSITDNKKASGVINPHLKDDISYSSNRLKLHADGGDKDLNPLTDDYEGSPGWSMCKRLKDSYSSNNLVGVAQEPLNMHLENPYSSFEDERSREMRSQEYGDPNPLEGKNPQVFDDNEYYDSGSNSLMGEESDYNHVPDSRAYIHKREGSRQQTGKAGASEAAKVIMDALTSSDSARPYNEDSLAVETLRENVNNAQLSGDMRNARDENAKGNLKPDSNLVWKLNSDLQSQALNNVMRNSQRALQEVQQFQQKLYYKPQEANENQGLKRESRTQEMKYHGKNINFDEKRLKREDEDEQKNMKTGTDEGGGGEYEDEEGKGHKDEEEYYEDADLSDDESGNEVRTTDEIGQKYVKREATRDNSKNSKEEQVEDNSQDYELSLENAPVENSEKSRKSSYREDNASY